MEQIRSLFSCATFFPSSKSRREKRREEIIAEVRAECQAWLDAIPMPMNAASNIMANYYITRFLRDEEVTSINISHIHNWISYRLDLMSLATTFKDMVGLEYPDCIGFDCSAWYEQVQYEQTCSQKLDLEDRYLGLLLRSGIFPLPTRFQGRTDRKPEHYLACAFADAGWTESQVESALRLMAARSGRLEDYPWR